MKSTDVFKNELEERTLAFAAAVVNALDQLPQREVLRVVTYQLSKSVTSVGANYREANHPESRADFIHKIAIILKECKETLFWLQFIQRLNAVNDTVKETFKPFVQEADELQKLFSSILRSAREHQKDQPL